MLNVTNLKAITGGALIGLDLESRCRSIARNAVQASREAHGIGSSLYTDDEAKRERMIEQILRLDLSKYQDESNDASLVSTIQPASPVINKISDILEKALENELSQPLENITVAEKKEATKLNSEEKSNKNN